jgi:putative membrane protein
MPLPVSLLAFSALADRPPVALAQTTGGRDSALQHQAAVLAYGSASLQMSRLALSKTGNTAVRRFAELEIVEQEILAEVLTLLGGERNAIAPQQQPKIENRVAIQRMETLTRGFDQAYVHEQASLHRQLLQLQDQYLSRANDPTFIAVAMLTRNRLREHLVMLEELQRTLG